MPPPKAAVGGSCRPAQGFSQHKRKGAGGQASVELALCLPFVAMLLLLVVQAGLLVGDQLAVVQAAREAARRASVDPDPEAVRRAALGGRVAPERTTVTIERLAASPAQVRTTIRHHAATDVPIIGRLLPDVELSAGATMAIEGG